MNIPFDNEGKGRIKAQIRNFNPKRTASYCAKSLGMCILIPYFGLYVLPAQIFTKVHFPIIAGRSEVPKNDKWEKVESKRGKYSFEYHHRNVNKYFTRAERNFFKQINHHELHEKSKSQKLGFYFDFSDQSPKIFKNLKIRLPFHWSGYDMKWWVLFDEHEEEIIAPSDQIYKEINLINHFKTNEPTKFSFHVQFTQKEEIPKPDDINLLTLDYQIIPVVDFNSDHQELLFRDGMINVPKSFIKEYMPAIEMLARNNQDTVVDLRNSPVTKNLVETLENFVQTSFHDITLQLEQNSAEELANLLLAFDYLMVPHQYIDLVTQLLKEKMTLENSFRILTQLPNEGLLANSKKILNRYYKSLFDEEFKKGNIIFRDLLRPDHSEKKGI